MFISRQNMVIICQEKSRDFSVGTHVEDELSYIVGWFSNQQNSVNLRRNLDIRKPIGILLPSDDRIQAKIPISFQAPKFRLN